MILKESNKLNTDNFLGKVGKEQLSEDIIDQLSEDVENNIQLVLSEIISEAIKEQAGNTNLSEEQIFAYLELQGFTQYFNEVFKSQAINMFIKEMQEAEEKEELGELLGNIITPDAEEYEELEELLGDISQE